MLFIADQWKVCCDSLNYLRRQTAKETGIIPEDTYNYLWVVDWPLFEYDEATAVGSLPTTHLPCQTTRGSNCWKLNLTRRTLEATISF